jgi:uncharacterized membrane protein
MPGFENLLNIHPLFVHFPIALTLSALLFEGLHAVTKSDQLRYLSTLLIYLSAVTAVATLVTGYIAAGTIGHDSPGHDMVHTHRDIMVLFTGIIVLLALLQAISASVKSLRGKGLWWTRLGYPVLLLISSLILVLGADQGGRLVFQYGIGVKMEIPSMELQDHSDHQHDMPEVPREVQDPVPPDQHEDHDLQP